jgi:glycosyltransferase involved in cell wall biosynthesis
MTLHEYLPICHRDGQMVRTVDEELCDHDSPRRCHECFPEVSPETFLLRKRFIQSHLQLVDLFTAPSEEALEQYVRWGIPRERITVEPYAVRPAPPAPVQERERRDRFAFFGQFTPYKGVDVLLEAMELLGERFEGHLWLHGGNLERQRPEFRARFEELVERKPATVTIAGSYERSELRRLMEGIDWVVVPSVWRETGPIVVLEAFQHARPVIATDVGGMAEKVADGVSGLQFRRSDPRSLAAAIERAAGEQGLWERLRSGIPAVPTIDERVGVLTAHYRDALERRGEGATREARSRWNVA